MHLVQHHVLEPLVVRRAHENVRRDGLAVDPARQNVFARVREPVLHQRPPAVDHRVARERRPAPAPPVKDRRLAGNELVQQTHRHARRDTVRVEANVRHDALLVERHVLLAQDQTAHALLPVAGRKLVAELWPPHMPGEHFDDTRLVLARGQHHLVHHHIVRPLVDQRARVQAGAHRAVHQVVRVLGRVPVHQHGPAVDARPDRGDPVLVQRVELWVARHDRVDALRRHEPVGRVVAVRAQRGGPLADHHPASEPAVQRRPVDDDGVLDIIA
mmetsp:Transcript_15575/g.49692  ORF Transcript_15575/g.49692 Transcript_15575/m.49692 type:complete len:272 (-) Transcript_15575:997-1812(-)